MRYSDFQKNRQQTLSVTADAAPPPPKGGGGDDCSAEVVELAAFIEHEIEQCSNSWEYVKIAAADSKKSQPLVHPVICHTLHMHGSL